MIINLCQGNTLFSFLSGNARLGPPEKEGFSFKCPAFSTPAFDLSLQREGERNNREKEQN